MASPFFLSSRGRFERGFNGARRRVGCYRRRVVFYNIYVGCYRHRVGSCILCKESHSHRGGCYSLYVGCIGAMRHVSYSLLAIAASMWDVAGVVSTVTFSTHSVQALGVMLQAQCGMLHPLCGLLQPLCGILQYPCGLLQTSCRLLQPLWMMHMCYVGY